METLTTLTAKKTFIKDNLDKLSDESRPTLSQINAFKAEDLETVDKLVEEINSFVPETEEDNSETNKPVDKDNTLKYETLLTEDGAEVEVVWLPYRKYGLRNGKVNYQFNFGVDKIITLQNNLLKPFRKVMNEGDLFPIKVLTIKPVPGDYGYSKQLFSGQIAEFACELLQEARIALIEEEEERADMTKEARELADAFVAKEQAKAYLAKKGIKMV